MTSVDRERIQAAVTELLTAIGDDPAREGLRDTPRRVAEFYAELYSGVGADPAAALGTTFGSPSAGAGEADASTPDARLEPRDQPASSPVLLRDITFRSVCEHHLLPFEGLAHVGYVPGDRIAGLGGVVAVIESASSRPQLQERLGDDIAEALERGLGARGVLVVLEARHGCVTARGPRQTGSSIVTLSARGILSEPAARAEMLALLRPAASAGLPAEGSAAR